MKRPSKSDTLFLERWTRLRGAPPGDDPSADGGLDRSDPARPTVDGASGRPAPGRIEAAEASGTLARRGSSSGRSSLERLRPELEALADHEVLRPNLDLATVGGLVLAALPQIEALAPEMPHLVSKEIVRGLHDRATAALEASGTLRMRERRWVRIEDRLREARRRRRVLRLSVTVAADAGLIDEEGPTVSHGRTSIDITKDLFALAQYFLRHLDELRGCTPLTAPFLTESCALALDLIERIGARRGPPRRTVDPASKALRARAFTLLVRDYEAVRAAVIFLRRLEGDADAIAPSLYSARRR